MSKVWIVQGEHPFSPYWPLEIYGSEESAAKRCAELTAEMLKEYWETAHDDTPLIEAPEVTVENWAELVEEYGDDDDFVQDDGWGRWWVEMQEQEIRA